MHILVIGNGNYQMISLEKKNMLGKKRKKDSTFSIVFVENTFVIKSD